MFPSFVRSPRTCRRMRHSRAGPGGPSTTAAGTREEREESLGQLLKMRAAGQVGDTGSYPLAASDSQRAAPAWQAAGGARPQRGILSSLDPSQDARLRPGPASTSRNEVRGEGLSTRVFLVNPSRVSFGTAVITPRWLYVLAAATGTEWGDPILVDETLEAFQIRRPEDRRRRRDWHPHRQRAARIRDRPGGSCPWGVGRLRRHPRDAVSRRGARARRGACSRQGRRRSHLVACRL